MGAKKTGLKKPEDDADATASSARARKGETAVVSLPTIKLNTEELAAVIFEGSGRDELGSWRNAVAVARTNIQDDVEKHIKKRLDGLVKKLREYRHDEELKAAEAAHQEAARKLAALKAQKPAGGQESSSDGRRIPEQTAAEAKS